MILLPPRVRDAMVATLMEQLPSEGCGLLLGDPETRTVETFWSCRNIAAEPLKHYRISPTDQLAAVQFVKQSSVAGVPIEIIAVVHSHPTAPAVPSTADMKLTVDDVCDSVIVSFAREDEVAIKAWQISAGLVVETLIIPV